MPVRLIVLRPRAATLRPGVLPAGLAACGLLMILMMYSPAALAQEAAGFRFSTDRPRAITSEAAPGVLQRPAADHYDVIALRVEFQPDDSRFSTGDGTFDGDLFGGLQPSIDPLPHDGAYFEAHLSFLKNYVRRASSGRTMLTTHLLPEVVRLPEPMGAYSPTGPESSSDVELSKLARLVADAWAAADAASDLDVSGFDPTRTAFLIFHAGVGRDIELIGTTLDKTPEDLPSLYFGESALNRLLPGEPIRFQGLDVDHTILSPRTETRRGTDFLSDEPFLAEFSINGMLAATFFSYLGVPDLFDTNTGESGIGPFGLMDPLGIFAFNGLLPPEPSAWTKQYLGWADQVVAEAEQTFAVAAASSEDESPQVRVPISDGEYFLVENRHRQSDGGGVTLTVYREGELVEEQFDNASTGFTRFDVSGFGGGVLVDASNFDWAVPGGLDEDGNELNGGFLIWHIDERIITQGLEENSVNANPRRRGVDLKEADGAQDIGFPTGGDFGPQTHLGSPFDFYFEGNPVRAVTRSGREVVLYRNRFGPETTPSSDSRAGGPSFVVLEDFSAPALEMTFRYRVESAAGLQPHEVLQGVAVGGAAGPGSELAYNGSQSIYVYSAPADGGVGVLTSIDIETGDVALVHAAATGRPAIGADGSVVYAAEEEGALIVYVDGERVQVADAAAPPSRMRPAMIGGDALVTDRRGRLLAVHPDRSTSVVVEGSSEVVHFLPVDDSRIFVLAADRARLLRYPAGQVEAEWEGTPGEATCGHPVAGIDSGGLVIAYACSATEQLVILDAEGQRVVNVADRNELAGSLAAEVSMADVDGDGRLDVVGSAGEDVFALSRNGAMAAGFPLAFPTPIRGEPLVISSGGRTYVVAAGADGYLRALAVGDPLDNLAGTPLSVGVGTSATPLLRQNMLLAVSDRGVLQAWSFDDAPDILWGERFGGPANARLVSVEDRAADPLEGDLLVEAETYNWPNPVRDSGTYLRVMTTRGATVDIKVIDASGRSIDELSLGSVLPEAPAEVFWRADIQSGLYFARVTATDAEGRKASAVIKMAVIR